MIDSLLTLIFIVGLFLLLMFVAGAIQNVRDHLAKDRENR